MTEFQACRAAAQKLSARLREKNPLTMGIVNVTPDSFSDGGRFSDAEAALAHGAALIAQGAEILDLGAESTRPGFLPVAADEEWRRLAPVVGPLQHLGVPVSIDTTKASVAREALKAGAAAINDVSGLRHDPKMADLAAESGAVTIVMHFCENLDEARDILADMVGFFDETLQIAQKAGVAREKLVLDPGVGFGKTLRQNLQAIKSCGALAAHYGLPALIGASRKSFIGALTGAPVDQRLAGTLAAHLQAFHAGAKIFRVHDVAEQVAALRIWDEIERA